MLPLGVEQVRTGPSPPVPARQTAPVVPPAGAVARPPLLRPGVRCPLAAVSGLRWRPRQLAGGGPRRGRGGGCQDHPRRVARLLSCPHPLGHPSHHPQGRRWWVRARTGAGEAGRHGRICWQERKGCRPRGRGCLGRLRGIDARRSLCPARRRIGLVGGRGRRGCWRCRDRRGSRHRARSGRAVARPRGVPRAGRRAGAALPYAARRRRRGARPLSSMCRARGLCRTGLCGTGFCGRRLCGRRLCWISLRGRQRCRRCVRSSLRARGSLSWQRSRPRLQEWRLACPRPISCCAVGGCPDRSSTTLGQPSTCRSLACSTTTRASGGTWRAAYPRVVAVGHWPISRGRSWKRWAGIGARRPHDP